MHKTMIKTQFDSILKLKQQICVVIPARMKARRESKQGEDILFNFEYICMHTHIRTHLHKHTQTHAHTYLHIHFKKICLHIYKPVMFHSYEKRVCWNIYLLISCVAQRSLVHLSILKKYILLTFPMIQEVNLDLKDCISYFAIFDHMSLR